jgi:hypothetical protein
LLPLSFSVFLLLPHLFLITPAEKTR